MKEDRTLAEPIKSSEDFLCEKKRKIAQKCFWFSLSIIGIILLFVTFIFVCSSDCKSSKQRRMEKSAVDALKLKITNPSSIEILDISVPDTVFHNRICPEYETVALSEKFLEYSLNVMQNYQENFFDMENSAYRCQMNRYNESSKTLQALNDMMSRPQGPHCGWRLKIKYKAIDESESPYVSETWFIFDKDKKHILNSYNISIL